eukprot:13881300-Heterocapsa_arctica.AAC.1
MCRTISEVLEQALCTGPLTHVVGRKGKALCLMTMSAKPLRQHRVVGAAVLVELDRVVDERVDVD